MSAYICNPEHIGILAAFAAANDCVIHEWRSGSWTIREWNHAIRMTVKHYMDNVERFHRVHGTGED